MRVIDIIFSVLAATFYLPILTYMVVKFGSAAYFREKQKHEDTKTKPNYE